MGSDLLDAARAELGRRDTLTAARAELASRQRPTQIDPADIPPEMVYNPETGQYVDTALAAQRMGQGYGAAATAAQGMLGAGEYFDESVGAMAGGGAAGDIATETVRQSQRQFQQAHPVLAPVMQMGAGIASVLPYATAVAATKGGQALSGFMQNTGFLQKAATATGIGSTGGAIEGAISGYGAGTDDRVKSAKERALVGGAFGGVLALGGAATGTGLKAAKTWFAQRPLKAAAREMGVSVEVTRALKQIADATDETEARKILQTMGDDAFLADLSPSARGALDALMQSHSQAGQVATKAISTRAMGIGSELDSALNDVMGSPQGQSVVASGIREPARQATTDAYNLAYRTAIDYSSPEGMAVEGVLARIDPDILGPAVKKANARLRWNDVDAEQIILSVADDGTVTQSGALNVAQLDYLKRALDTMRRDGTDAITGKMDSTAQLAGEMAREVRNAARAASPAYREALELAADTAGREEAVTIGANLFKAQTTRDMAARQLRGMSGSELTAAREGAREFIDDALSNVRRTVMDPDVDIREVQKLLGDLSSRSAQKKLVLLLGAKKAHKLVQHLDRAGIALMLRASTVSNSRTFGREVAMDSMKRSAESGGVLRALGRGEAVTSSKRVIQSLTGLTDDAIEARGAGLLADIADALVNIRGKNAERAISLMRGLDAGKPISESRARAIVKGLRPYWTSGGHATALGMQQQTTRQLTEDQ